MEQPKQVNWDLEKEKVDKKLKSILVNCVSEDEFYKLRDKLGERHEELFNEGKSETEVWEDPSLRLLMAELEKTALIVETLPEMRYALELLGFEKDFVDHTLAHENSHANMGESLGARHVHYVLGIFKNSDGGLMLAPGAAVRFFANQGIDTEERREKNIKIGEAPEVYGDRLSESDIKQINKLKNNT